MLDDIYGLEILPMADASKPKRGRPKNNAPSRKVEPTLAPEEFAALERLVDLGYGHNPTDVARYLIRRELDDLKRTGVLKVDLPP